MHWFLNRDEGRLRAGWRLLFQFVMMLLLVGLGFAGANALNLNTGFLHGILISGSAFTLSVWIATRYLDRRPFSSLGLRFDRLWYRELGAGLGFGALAMLAIFLIELAVGWIHFTGFGWERAFEPAYPLPLLGYLVGMILVGFYEELVFRGYQITNMIEGLSGGRLTPERATLFAVLISSFLFGILHAGNPNASMISTVNIIIAGVVLALPYLLTGRLALSVGLHTSWNFFQGGIFGFPVSGSPTRSSLLQINETGPDLLTGGSFGPEAGLMGILGLLLIIWMYFFFARKLGYPIDLHSRFKEDFHSPYDRIEM